MKLCANLSFMFNEVESLEQRYRLAKEAGFRYVECAFPYNEDKEGLRRALQETDLTQVLINTVPGDSLGHGARPGEEALFRANMATALDYCSAMGATKLHIMAGKRIPGVDRTQALETFKQNIRWVRLTCLSFDLGK